MRALVRALAFVFRRDDAAAAAASARHHPLLYFSLCVLPVSRAERRGTARHRDARATKPPGVYEAEKERGKRPRASASLGGGILNLGGSIDFTIWTPPKVKNKPSQTYSTLIECLSSARLVSTHSRDGDTKRETWKGWRRAVGLEREGVKQPPRKGAGGGREEKKKIAIARESERVRG